MSGARGGSGVPALLGGDAPARRLRPGPGGPAREQIAEVQRARLIAGAADAIMDVGYQRMSVAEIIARARVSRKTFYDLFEDRDACVLAMLDRAVSHASAIATDAYAEPSDWRSAVRAGLAALLALMDQEPGLARLCLVETLGVGGRIRDRHVEVMRELVAVIDRGRELSASHSQVTDVTAEGVVGAIHLVLHTRLLAPSEEPVLELLNPLMSMIVLPYLGARAARAELARSSTPAPVRGRRERTPRGDPIAGMNMRLTYRTVRVLTVIAESPGSNNREIACEAGVVDQGQISKLLNRLARLGLIENRGVGQAHGGANAWFLTGRGAELEHATRPREPIVSAGRRLLSDHPALDGAARPGSRARINGAR